MALPYRMEIYWDENYWAAEFPELSGLAADGDTLEELWESIKTNKRVWFESMLEHGHPIPLPDADTEQFSGRFVVRLPKTIHRQAVRAAQRNGVSLNQFFVAAIARELGRREGLEQKVEAATRKE
jgi:antitoxin HicB